MWDYIDQGMGGGVEEGEGTATGKRNDFQGRKTEGSAGEIVKGSQRAITIYFKLPYFQLTRFLFWAEFKLTFSSKRPWRQRTGYLD